LETVKIPAQVNQAPVPHMDLHENYCPSRVSVFSYVVYLPDILKRREQYMFDEFVRQWDMRKSMDKFAEFLNFVSFKHNLNVETCFRTTTSS
jgi:hypothetical protein